MLFFLFKGITGQHFQSSFQNYQNQQQSNLVNKDVQKLQKSNQNLQEDNNMLKVKNEILIDMIAEVYSEFKLETEKKSAKK